MPVAHQPGHGAKALRGGHCFRQYLERVEGTDAARAMRMSLASGFEGDCLDNCPSPGFYLGNSVLKCDRLRCWRLQGRAWRGGGDFGPADHCEGQRQDH